MNAIFVTNKNKFPHIDAFNGAEYFWQPGDKVEVPEEAAEHMFGYNRKDKTENLQRLGWATKMNDKGMQVNDPEGPKKLGNFIFSRGVMVEVPAEEETADTK